MAENGSVLVTGAAGQLGAVGRTVTGLLLERGLPVRAMVRREDDRAAALRAAGVEVMVGDLLEPADVYRVLSGCRRVYLGMSLSPGYLEATVTMATVAREVGVDALVNMSQMTVSQMSIRNTTPSPQQRQHWLSEQALAWSGLPVITIRPTVFLEGFFLPLTGPSVRDRSGTRIAPLFTLPLPKVSSGDDSFGSGGRAMAETATRTGQASRQGEARAHSEGVVARSIEQQTAKLPSDVFLWAAFASMGGSLLLQFLDKKHESLFVGQWAPTFLILGLYDKLVKVAGSDRVTA